MSSSSESPSYSSSLFILTYLLTNVNTTRKQLLQRARSILYWFFIVSSWRIEQTHIFPTAVKTTLCNYARLCASSLSSKTSPNNNNNTNNSDTNNETTTIQFETEVISIIFIDEVQQLEVLLNREPSLITKRISGFTLLERSISLQSFQCALLLIKKGSPCNNSLSYVRCVESAKLILDHCPGGAHVNVLDSDSRHALTVAASRGLTEVCLYLIDRGAHLTLESVQIARSMHHEDTAQAIEHHHRLVLQMVDLMLFRKGIFWSKRIVVSYIM
jgi:hypothetical protein